MRIELVMLTGFLAVIAFCALMLMLEPNHPDTSKLRKAHAERIHR